MIDDIIKSVNKNIIINDYIFNNKVLSYFKNLNSIKYRLKENKYELTGIIYYLLDNITEYNIGINLNIKPDKKTCYYRRKKLSLLEVNNFEYCLNSNNINIKFEDKKDKNKVYLIFSKSYIFNYQISNINLITLTQLFGIENFNILKHINIKRFNKLLKTEYGINSYNKVVKYKKLLLNIEDYIINNIIFINSIVLFLIGTTIIKDVDVLIYNSKDDKKIKDLSLKMAKENINFNIYEEDYVWYSHTHMKKVNWMKQEINIDLVHNSGANELEDFYFDSEYYFYMYGIKCGSLNLQIEKLIKQNSIFSYVNLIALTIHNNLNLKPNLCISNVRLHNGKKTIITEKDYNIIVDNIIKYLKKWHNTIYPIENIFNIFPLCKIESYDKYLKKNKYEKLFNNLRNYHQYIKLLYLQKYCNKGILIDVGSSNLKNIKFWKQLHLTRIISIEPSEDLYREGLIRLAKDEFANKYITFIRGVGEKDWSNGDGGLDSYSKKKIMEIANIKVDSITFEFTIHYMIYNEDILLKNLQRVSKKGTKIIIHCLNGDLISKLLKDTTRFIIYKADQEVFILEKKYENTDKSRKISVFFRNVQGLDNIVDEYLVMNESLINIFIKYNYKLLININFIENYDERFHLESYELDISKLYISYIFEYLGDKL